MKNMQDVLMTSTYKDKAGVEKWILVFWIF
jgi:hypothetical protein